MHMAVLPLPNLWRLFVRHHGALCGFARAHQSLWTPEIRRMALHALAFISAMLRRLIHLEAMEITVLPCPPRDPAARLSPLGASAPARPPLRFRLTETPRRRARSAAIGGRAPDSPDLSHALFLERLGRLASVYRARHRLARRLARRVRSGCAPLRRPALPARIHRRAPQVFIEQLAALDRRIATRDSPLCSAY
jgi:hypothetical protein